MKPETIVLVQKSFKAVAPIADEAGALFYRRLFETHPELRPMFPEDIGPQAKKLMQMLALVVNGLHRLEELMPAVESLARRHASYGVQPEHYPQVGAALIWTLETSLGDDFTPKVRQAWVIAYATLTDAMIAATIYSTTIH